MRHFWLTALGLGLGALLIGLPLLWSLLFRHDRWLWQQQVEDWRQAGRLIDWPTYRERVLAEYDIDLDRQQRYRTAMEAVGQAPGEDWPSVEEPLLNGEALSEELLAWRDDPAIRAAVDVLMAVLAEGPVAASEWAELFSDNLDTPTLDEIAGHPSASLFHDGKLAAWLAIQAEHPAHKLTLMRRHSQTMVSTPSLISLGVRDYLLRLEDTVLLAAVLDGHAESDLAVQRNMADEEAALAKAFHGAAIKWYRPIIEMVLEHRPGWSDIAETIGQRRLNWRERWEALIFVFDWRRSRPMIAWMDNCLTAIQALRDGSHLPVEYQLPAQFGMHWDAPRGFHDTIVHTATRHHRFHAAALLARRFHAGQPLPDDEAAALELFGDLAEIGRGLSLRYERLSPSRFRIGTRGDGGVEAERHGRIRCSIGTPSLLRPLGWTPPEEEPDPPGRGLRGRGRRGRIQIPPRRFWQDVWNLEIELTPDDP